MLIKVFENKIVDIPDSIKQDYEKTGFLLNSRRVEYFILTSGGTPQLSNEELTKLATSGIKEEIEVSRELLGIAKEIKKRGYFDET